MNELTVPKGKTLAIVGGSGSSKSTLVALLLLCYDSQKGDILIDSSKTTDYNIKWLRERMSIVSQEPSLFNISIKDNIKYG